MFLIHPIWQSVGIMTVIYVWGLGFSRFRSQHLNQKVRFDWKRHVRFGLIGTSVWLAGICGGLYMVKSSWYGFLITGVHGKTGILLIPFIFFAMGSGLYMDRKKKKRKILPLVHGISNTMMLLLALSQIYTGVMVYREYVMGM